MCFFLHTLTSHQVYRCCCCTFCVYPIHSGSFFALRLFQYPFFCNITTPKFPNALLLFKNKKNWWICTISTHPYSPQCTHYPPLQCLHPFTAPNHPSIFMNNFLCKIPLRYVFIYFLCQLLLQWLYPSLWCPPFPLLPCLPLQWLTPPTLDVIDDHQFNVWVHCYDKWTPYPLNGCLHHYDHCYPLPHQLLQ